MKDAVEKKVHYIIEACDNLKKEAAYHILNEEGFLKDSKAILSYNENEQALKPIDDEDLAQKVSQKLLEVIDEYSTFMTDEAINILTKKINNINKPVNVDRLTKSFSILGIKLNDHDENTLRTRNKFLHGSTPFKNFEIDKEKENEFILLTTKLRLLICMLLLKYLGYKGHIYNFYGHSKSIEAKSLIEHFVRFI